MFPEKKIFHMDVRLRMHKYSFSVIGHIFVELTSNNLKIFINVQKSGTLAGISFQKKPELVMPHKHCVRLFRLMIDI